LFNGVEVEAKFYKLKVKLHIEDWIQENLYFLGEYETAELKSMEQFISKEGVFIDVGANIGLFSLYASQFTNQVICFEPFPQNFNSLKQNIKLNNLPNVRLENRAIGETEGVINLYYDDQEKNLGMVSTKPLENGIKKEVKVVSLDSYLMSESISNIDFIKIDIEGFEYQALLGMRSTLETYHPTLLIEILDQGGSTNQDNKCDNLLKELGYKKYFIDDEGGLSEREVNRNRMNYIFTTKKIELGKLK